MIQQEKEAAAGAGQPRPTNFNLTRMEKVFIAATIAVAGVAIATAALMPRFLL